MRKALISNAEDGEKSLLCFGRISRVAREHLRQGNLGKGATGIFKVFNADIVWFTRASQILQSAGCAGETKKFQKCSAVNDAGLDRSICEGIRVAFNGEVVIDDYFHWLGIAQVYLQTESNVERFNCAETVRNEAVKRIR